jgi:hypothetical protein
LQETDQTWLNLDGLHQVDLRLSLREAVQDPSVDMAVALSKARVDHSQQDVVGNVNARLLSLLDFDFDGRVLLRLGLQQLLWAHVDETESLGKDFSLGRTTGAWPSDQDDLGWSSWRVVSESNFHHADEVVAGISCMLVTARVVEVNELVERLVDSS